MMKAIWNGAIVAESDDTVLVEGNHYFPLESRVEEYFTASKTRSVCPWKGPGVLLLDHRGRCDRHRCRVGVQAPVPPRPEDQGTRRVRARRRGQPRRLIRQGRQSVTERPVESTVDVVVVGMGVAGEAVATTR